MAKLNLKEIKARKAAEKAKLEQEKNNETPENLVKTKEISTDLENNNKQLEVPERKIKMEDTSAQEEKQVSKWNETFAEMRNLKEQGNSSEGLPEMDYKEVIDFEVANPDFSAQDFINTMESMREELLKQSSPELPEHCKQILMNLKQHDELSYLLSPAQIGVITSGLIKYTGIVVSPKKKNASSADLNQRLERESGGNISSLL